MFQVFFTSRAEKEFGKLPKGIQQTLYDELKVLARNPFKHSSTKKLRGTKFGYRLRIGRWRILFALFTHEKRIEVVDIFLKKGEQDYIERRGLLK